VQSITFHNIITRNASRWLGARFWERTGNTRDVRGRMSQKNKDKSLRLDSVPDRMRAWTAKFRVTRKGKATTDPSKGRGGTFFGKQDKGSSLHRVGTSSEAKAATMKNEKALHVFERNGQQASITREIPENNPTALA